MNGDKETSGHLGAVATKMDPHEVTAEMVYCALNELRSQAQGIFELQIVTNEKLINNPVDAPDKKAAPEVDRPVNPRHFPAFRDICRDISMVLQATRRLQEYLAKHV